MYNIITNYKRNFLQKAPRGEVDSDTLAHRLRREQYEQEEQTRSSLHINEVEAKERRVQENLNAILCYREKNIKERRYLSSKFTHISLIFQLL